MSVTRLVVYLFPFLWNTFLYFWPFFLFETIVCPFLKWFREVFLYFCILICEFFPPSFVIFGWMNVLDCWIYYFSSLQGYAFCALLKKSWGYFIIRLFIPPGRRWGRALSFSCGDWPETCVPCPRPACGPVDRGQQARACGQPLASLLVSSGQAGCPVQMPWRSRGRTWGSPSVPALLFSQSSAAAGWNAPTSTCL